VSLEEQKLDSGREAPTAPQPPKPSSIRFSCPSCQMVLEVEASLEGARAPCPGCRTEIAAPVLKEPQPIAVKSRPHRPRSRPKESPTGSASASALHDDHPAMEYPPSEPLRSAANPPIPREAPIPSQREEGGRRVRAEIPLRREARHRPGSSVDPIDSLSEKDHERKEVIATLKIVIAVAITIAIALGVVSITKRSVNRPGAESREEGSKSP
jgi:hypothetical protein